MNNLNLSIIIVSQDQFKGISKKISNLIFSSESVYLVRLFFNKNSLDKAIISRGEATKSDYKVPVTKSQK